MKVFCYFVLLFVSIFYFTNIILADTVWELVDGIKDASIKEVHIKNGIIYAVSEKRLPWLLLAKNPAQVLVEQFTDTGAIEVNSVVP